MRHLPTTGGGPAMTARLGGHAAAWASPPALSLPHLKSRKLRALATWGATRLAAFPDVPTLKEVGYDVEYYRDATRHAVQDPAFKTAMGKIETPIAYQDADEFKGLVGPRRADPRRGDQANRQGRGEVAR